MSFMVVIIFAFTSLFFIVKIQRELEKNTVNELNITTKQLQNELNTKFGNVLRISNLIYSDNVLNRRLNHAYTEPYEYWEFYSFLTEYSEQLMEIENSIKLITIFTPSETLKPDKKNIRSISELEDMASYEEVMNRNGSAVFFMMRDAVANDYFNYNLTSNKNNLCMMRMIDYDGTKSILMIEITKQIFINEFCTEPDKGMYVTDSSGNVVIHYENSTNVYEQFERNESVTKLHQNYLSFDATLDNQWTLSLYANKDKILAPVNENIRNLVLTCLLIILIALFIIVFVLRKISVRLLRLNDVIRKSYVIRRKDSISEPVEQDEIDLVLTSFEQLLERVDYLLKEVYEKEIENKSMELELLHSQIKPHFLYNTLSSIASLARKYQDQQLMSMITSLSDLYRVSLNRGKDIISIQKEIEITKSYLVIMENRFQDLIHVEITAEEEALTGLIPKVLLQPFVENAINHAIRPDRILNIIITIQRITSVHESKDEIIFQVEDDGLGMDEEKTKLLLNESQSEYESEGGYGIPNVHRRIQIFAGEPYGVEIKSLKDVGTTVTITVPYKEITASNKF